MFLDAWGEGTPIFHIFGDLESDVLKPALEILYELATEAVESVKVLVSDFTGSFVKVWRESFPNFEIKHVKCELDNAWKKQLLFLHDAKLHHCLKYLGLIPSDGVPVDSDLDPNCEEIDSLEVCLLISFSYQMARVDCIFEIAFSGPEPERKKSFCRHETVQEISRIGLSTKYQEMHRGEARGSWSIYFVPKYGLHRSHH